MLKSGGVGFDLFLNRKLIASKEFQFLIIHLFHKLCQIEKCYEDDNSVLEFGYLSGNCFCF